MLLIYELFPLLTQVFKLVPQITQVLVTCGLPILVSKYYQNIQDEYITMAPAEAGLGKLASAVDFQKLEVYQKSKLFHTEIIAFIRDAQIHKATADQLFRASLSIPLNIAEGSGRFIAKDRGNFFIFDRSSVLVQV